MNPSARLQERDSGKQSASTKGEDEEDDEEEEEDNGAHVPSNFDDTESAPSTVTTTSTTVGNANNARPTGRVVGIVKRNWREFCLLSDVCLSCVCVFSWHCMWLLETLSHAYVNTIKNDPYYNLPPVCVCVYVWGYIFI